MRRATESFIYLFAKIAGGAFLVVLIGGLFLSADIYRALTLSYLLSLLFVGSNLLIVRKIDLADNRRFLRIFFASIVIRFVLVLASIVFVLRIVEVNPAYFTISFIIFYFLHSVMELVFINSILESGE